MKKLLIYWLPVAVYALFIYWVSSKPGKAIPNLFTYQSEIFHFLEYAGFALVNKRAIKGSFAEKNKFKCVLLTAIIVLIYSISDEFHQSFVPGRDASLYDIFVDNMGSILGNLIYL